MRFLQAKVHAGGAVLSAHGDPHSSKCKWSEGSSALHATALGGRACIHGPLDLRLTEEVPALILNVGPGPAGAQAIQVAGANSGLYQSRLLCRRPHISATLCWHPCRSLQLSRLPLPCVQVLKMKFAAPITGADVGLKREWIIGQHLNTLGDDGDEMSGAALHTLSLRARSPCVVRLA